MPKTAKFTLQYLCLFLTDSRLPAEQTLPHGAAPHDCRCLLKNPVPPRLPQKKTAGRLPPEFRNVNACTAPGVFSFHPDCRPFFFLSASGKTTRSLMKRVPETDQPCSRDDSHQEPTENFTPHASDHGESAENAEHTGGKSVRSIGKYLLSIQPRPGLKRTGYQTAQDKKHAKRPQRLPGLPSAPEGIGAGRRSVKGYGRTQHAGPQAGNASTHTKGEAARRHPEESGLTQPAG